MKRSTAIRLVSNVLVSSLVLGAILAIFLDQPRILQLVDQRIYDVLLLAQDPGTPHSAPAIIDIDEKSLAELGQWPWPRYTLALLIKTLTESGAAAIALDIILPEEDQTSPRVLQENMQEKFGVTMTMEGLPEHLWSNDDLLASVMRQAPVVNGIYFHFDDQITHVQEDFKGIPSSPDRPIPQVGVAKSVPVGALPPDSGLLHATSVTVPFGPLLDAAAVGSINVSPDGDGVIRSLPAVILMDGKYYPSLSLRALMVGLGTKTMVLASGPDGLHSIRVGKYTFPVAPNGLYRLFYRGPSGTYPYFSAVDVLQGRVVPEELAGRILFIGTSASGLKDIRITPFDTIYPGVEAHATFIDTILSNHYIVSPPWAPGAQFLLIMLVGIICVFAYSLARPIVYVFIAIFFACGAVFSSYYLLAQGMYFSPLYSLITVVSLGFCLLMLRFWQVDKQKFVLQKAFSNYVAPEVVNRIAERGGNILQGESREVTLIFTDIRGFTSISEKLRPEQVVEMLNRYFTPMTRLITKSGGTMDKFIGDAIMAFWNAPLDVQDHPHKAIQCALDMQTALEELNNDLEKDLGIRLRIGSGVHTGLVHVGNMGSEALMDYTCIGDTVNLASRLEGMCSVYGVRIVTSGITKSFCKDSFAFHRLDIIQVKGKSQPVEIFTVLPPEEAHARMLELSRVVLAQKAYLEGNFSYALQLFRDLQAGFPQEKIYAMYVERCTQLAQNPPENWDGVWIFDSK